MYNMQSGHTKWGAGGALYLQSAIAGLNSVFRVLIGKEVLRQTR